MRRLALILLACVLITAPVATPVAAQQAGDQTPTPTPAENQTDANETAAQPEVPSAPDTGGPIAANLYVEQPRHVDSSVSQSSSDGLNVYNVNGQIHELDPDRFTGEQVIRSGVREAGATLRYDTSIDRWILDTQGQSGSYRVFWEVRQGGEERTYAAVINVGQAQYEHVNPDQYEQLQNDAEFAQSIREEFADAGIVSADASREEFHEAISDAITWYQFYLSPLSALGGQFFQLGVLLISWPAGWIIFGVLFLAYFIRDRSKTKQLRRLKRQFANIEDVDEAEREAWERELKRSLSMQTFEDLGLTSSDAQAIREHFDISNPRQFLDKLRDWMDEAGWAGIILDAHAQKGHSVRVERNEEGDVVDAELSTETPPADAGMATDGGAMTGEEAGITYVNPGDIGRETILALDWGDLEPGLLWDDEVDDGELQFPIANGPDAGREDLVDAFDVPLGEDGQSLHIIERREEFADILLTVIQHIAASQHCDEDGRIRPEMEMIDFLFTFTAVGSEKYRWPLHNTADILMRNFQRLDASERMREMTRRSRDGEMTSDPRGEGR